MGFLVFFVKSGGRDIDSVIFGWDFVLVTFGYELPALRGGSGSVYSVKVTVIVVILGLRNVDSGLSLD